MIILFLSYIKIEKYIKMIDMNNMHTYQALKNK